MSEQSAPEPTMEEILASIRRIISEDDAPGAQAKLARQTDDSWEPAEIEAPAAASDGAEAAEEAAVHGDAPAETHGDIEVHAAPAEVAEPEPAAAAPEPEPEPEPIAAAASPPAEAPATPPRVEPALVGDDAAGKVASAFDRLAAAAAPPPPAASASPALPAPGRTLEDLTRELLHPLIKGWLDENLPGIVQARVDEEVERIVRGRVR